MRRLADYHFIMAWGLHCGWSKDQIVQTQADALLDGMDTRVIYQHEGTWKSVDDLKHLPTRAILEDLARIAKMHQEINS